MTKPDDTKAEPIGSGVRTAADALNHLAHAMKSVEGFDTEYSTHFQKGIYLFRIAMLAEVTRRRKVVAGKVL